MAEKDSQGTGDAGENKQKPTIESISEEDKVKAEELKNKANDLFKGLLK